MNMADALNLGKLRGEIGPAKPRKRGRQAIGWVGHEASSTISEAKNNQARADVAIRFLRPISLILPRGA